MPGETVPSSLLRSIYNYLIAESGFYDLPGTPLAGKIISEIEILP